DHARRAEPQGHQQDRPPHRHDASHAVPRDLRKPRTIDVPRPGVIPDALSLCPTDPDPPSHRDARTGVWQLSNRPGITSRMKSKSRVPGVERSEPPALEADRIWGLASLDPGTRRLATHLLDRSTREATGAAGRSLASDSECQRTARAMLSRYDGA